MKKFFGFGSSTPPPPPPPAHPPAPPSVKPAPTKPAPAAKEPTIIGRWKEPNGTDTTEFHADGTVVEKPASGETIRGRYSLEGAKLKIKLDAVPNQLSFAAVVKEDGLELKDANGEVTHYHRVA